MRFNLAPDAAMLLVLGLVCAGGYWLWIGPSLEAVRAKAAATEACLGQEKRYRAARADHWRVRHTLQDLREQLEREGGGMPPRETVDQRIAEMADIAERCGVIIEEVDPEDLPSGEEYVETQIRFRARASYTAFRHFLREVEDRMSYVDLTHFSASAGSGPAGPVCRLAWSLRMYSRSEGADHQEGEVRGEKPSSPSGSGAA